MITLRRDRFEAMLLRRAGEQDPFYNQVWNELSLGHLRDFWKPGGMSIGGFSRLMQVPVSTVRYYLQLDLLEPYCVEGRYRFHPFNCWELRSIVHWQEFGLTLDEIVSRRKFIQEKRPGTLVLDVLGPLEIQGKSYAEGLVYLRRVAEGSGHRETVVFGCSDGEQPPCEESEQLFRELREELERTQHRLQAKLSDLRSKLARLAEKRAALN